MMVAVNKNKMKKKIRYALAVAKSYVGSKAIVRTDRRGGLDKPTAKGIRRDHHITREPVNGWLLWTADIGF